jgi:alkylation response protein AidB-like acyl-CoA dehydrogenase
MDDSLYFSEQHLAVREMVRQFARDEVAPTAARFDADSIFPWDNVKKMGELGLLGVPWSEELGGAGLDLLSYMITIEELAKVDASTGLTVSAHTTLGTSPIVHFGTEAQRQRYVPLLASGKVLGGFGLTEPDAGSDAGGTRTTAVKKDGRYVLHHPRQRRRDLHRHRRHRSHAGHQGHQLVHRHQADVGPGAHARARHRTR